MKIDGRALKYCKSDAQKDAVRAVVNNGTQKAAAESLGVNIRTLERHIKNVKLAAIEMGDYLLPMRAQSELVRDKETNTFRWDKTELRREDNVVSLFERMQAGIDCKIAKPVNAPKRIDNDICSVLQLADAHLGMLASGLETGSVDYNLKIAVENITYAVNYLFPPNHKVKHGVLLNGGDLLHFDGMIAKTNKSGHELDGSNRYPEIIDAATALVVYICDLMLKRCETVHVMNVPGNHDQSSLLWLNLLLRYRYEKESRITIPDNKGLVLTHEWEKNFIYAHHGHGVNNQKMYNNMTDRFSAAYGRAINTWMLKAHFHTGQREHIGRTRVETMQTMTPIDAWHSESLYGSLRGMHRQDLRSIGTFGINVPFNPAIEGPHSMRAAA